MNCDVEQIDKRKDGTIILINDFEIVFRSVCKVSIFVKNSPEIKKNSGTWNENTKG